MFIIVVRGVLNVGRRLVVKLMMVKVINKIIFFNLKVKVCLMFCNNFIF